jgi:DNA-binding MarR family transcriptional regulator
LALLGVATEPEVPAAGPAPGEHGGEREESLVLDLSAIEGRLGAALDAGLRSAGVTGAEYAVLDLLDVAGPLTTARITRSLGLDPAAWERKVREMAARGLLATWPGPAARRQLTLVQLTDRGRDRLAAARPLVAAAMRPLHGAGSAGPDRPGDMVDDVRRSLRSLSAALDTVLLERDREGRSA